MPLAGASAHLRFFSTNVVKQSDTRAVKLRGTHLKARGADLPTMIWLGDIVEDANNFKPFFDRTENKVRDVRNVWLLNIRNQGHSDHHDSYDMEEMGDDIVRFMDENKITMATIGGHGFGAKVATATAIGHMNRFTGVVCLDGGPVDHRYHEAYLELKEYISFARGLNLPGLDVNGALKALEKGIACPKWRGIFKQNLDTEKGTLAWKNNMEALWKNTQKHMPDVAIWSQSYGLWPGNALALFAAHSRWIHLSTNTLPFYNTFPRLQGEFPG
jgi:pimeloyl-ACP methyl ester carboxylesterase